MRQSPSPVGEKLKLLGLILVAGALLAGCIDTPASSDLGALSADESQREHARVVDSFSWEGYVKVGAGGEPLGHFYPSDQHAAALWSPGFVVEIVEAPEVLEFRLDWTTMTPTTGMILMVHGPHGAERDNETGWSEYTTWHAVDDVPGQRAMPTVGPLCMSIPRADIEEDLARVAEAGDHHAYDGAYWYPMAHSDHGVDIKLNFTVTSVGGRVLLSEALHGHDSNSDEFQNAAETETKGPTRPYESCVVSVEP